MLGHRVLTMEDYGTMLKRRWWIVAIPALLLPIVAYAASYLVPPQYVSQTLVLVEQQKVPDDYVRSVISEDLSSRLASMSEQIMSRSRLEPIIEKYNLYGNKKQTMDDRLDLVRKDIGIKPIGSRNGGVPGFYISFRASEPKTAQLVCGEITSLFVTENLHQREQSAEGTTDFLTQQLNQAKHTLDDQDAKLAEFKMTYMGRLPGDDAANSNMLSSLGAQLDAATQALSRMEQDHTYMQALLAQQVHDQSLAETGDRPSAAPGAQQMELRQLQAQEAELTARYTPDYPDVVAVRRQIAELRRQMAAPAAPSPSRDSAPRSNRPESPSVQQLRAQLRAQEQAIAQKKQDQMAISGQMRGYQEKLHASPKVEEDFKNMTRDYQNAQKSYDDLLAKKTQSKMATDLERRQQGEQFRVMDEPNLPDAPTFPRRNVYGMGGLAAGLLLGLGISGLLEYRDTALRSERDIWAFTKLPTLGVISLMEEPLPAEKQSRPRIFGRRRDAAALAKPLNVGG